MNFTAGTDSMVSPLPRPADTFVPASSDTILKTGQESETADLRFHVTEGRDVEAAADIQVPPISIHNFDYRSCHDSAVDHANLGDICSICLDTIKDDDDVRGLICVHAFHASCIDKWLSRRKACCPLCKFDYALALAK